MANLWYKYEKAPKRNKQALRSLLVGLVCFFILFLFTKFVSIPLCPVKNIFNISCPGCGLTSAFIAILKFDFVSAFRYNVLSIPIFLGIAAYAVICVTDIFFEKNNLEKIEKICMKKGSLAFFAIVTVVSTIVNNLI